MRTIQPGSTDRSVYLRALDSTDGTPETGIAYNTSGIALFYRRDGAAATTITPADLAALTTGHTDGGVKHVNAGIFRLDVPDAAWVAGSETVVIGGSATGMIFKEVEVQIAATLQPIRTNTATAGGASTITLDASASSGNGFYDHNIVQIVAGTGAGQARIITGYVGSTKVATVDTAWSTNPASGSVFAIWPLGITGMSETDVRSAVFGATASSYDASGTMGEKINDAGAAGTPPTEAEIVTELMATNIATGTPFGDFCRGVAAALLGKTARSGTTWTARNIEDTKDAITATTDGTNQRTAVTRNLTQ